MRGEALRVELKLLTNTHLFYILRLSICSTLRVSQHKIFNLPFMSGWCCLFFRRDLYKWDRKLECETSGTVLTCICSCTKCYMTPQPGELSGTLRAVGVNKGGKEGRKVSVGANSPDTGEKSCCCFCQSPAPAATISVSCLATVVMPTLEICPVRRALRFTLLHLRTSKPQNNIRRGCGQHCWALQFLYPKASGHSRSL